ncbi:MAG: TIGR01244 family phosphatase [Hyphomicrobiales bacterium]|nr:TIGR01244 family phosphatase [Hyphomicrobiales bacterium]
MARAKFLAPHLAVAPQISPADLPDLARQGFKSIICNRPDHEGGGQPSFASVAAAAKAAGLQAVHLPVRPGAFGEREARAFASHVKSLPQPILAYCASGNRAGTLFKMSEKVAAASKGAAKLATGGQISHDIVILGGGAAGLAVAKRLKALGRGLDMALIDPAPSHFYQSGWTMVGAGLLAQERTRGDLAALMPRGVRLIRGAAVAVDAQKRQVRLADGRQIGYGSLVVASGLKLDWGAIEGLEATLGKNGVTSNYRHDLAPYSWQLIKGLKRGRALFTQPPLPFKGVDAPQKALYLAGDHWRRAGTLADINMEFFSADEALFGIAAYVPALQDYIDKYRVNVHYRHQLTKIDGPSRRACFTRFEADGSSARVEAGFDMIHVVPPQTAPDWIKASPLADATGFVDVDPASLRHRSLAGIYALGDVCNAATAKTAAAASRQAQVVAHNLLKDRGLITGADAAYDGYSACALTVERGKAVLAEFGYDGRLLASRPTWLVDGTRPSRLAWHLHKSGVPPLFRHMFARGREGRARPATR